ncbi:hypothetical protein AZH90_004361 [Salmonella enterica subsp. enterica serovar Legon]|nr:hypothetical protein [Salmonella enterica subsp. enterica serovar Legon]EDW9825505.1 hypothetical protein [Salmonella enterica]EDZ3589497.1 hypothetical protein [Salmonella enterica subsp. enterica serovar Wagenia]
MSTKPSYTACYLEGRIIVTRHQNNTSQTVAILSQNTQLMLDGDKIIQLPTQKNGPEKAVTIDVPDAAGILDAISTARHPVQPGLTTGVFMQLVGLILITLCIAFGVVYLTEDSHDSISCYSDCMPG